MNNIISEINKSNNIVLLCHNNPDGDAIGSVLALFHLLTKMGKSAYMYVKDPPKKFNFLDGFSLIKDNPDSKKYDLAIVVDTANLERLNNPGNVIIKADKILVIDHHVSNTKYGDINYVKVCSSCCEIIFSLIKEMNIPFDTKIASSLCTGMLTDTGGLSHFDVTCESFKMAACLSEIVDIPSIYKKVLDTISKNQFELTRIGIERLEFFCNDKIAFSYITYDDLSKLDVNKEDADILANLGRNINTVDVSIFVRIYEDETRVSMRSNGLDVNKIAALFGGGGHKLAAGFTTNINYELLKNKLIEEVGKEIEKRNINC